MHIFTSIRHQKALGLRVQSICTSRRRRIFLVLIGAFAIYYTRIEFTTVLRSVLTKQSLKNLTNTATNYITGASDGLGSTIELDPYEKVPDLNVTEILLNSNCVGTFINRYTAYCQQTMIPERDNTTKHFCLCVPMSLSK